MDAQQPTVLIAVVVGGGVVHPVMPAADQEQTVRQELNGSHTSDVKSSKTEASPVENVEVQACEHAFPRASSREGASSAHHHVEHSERDEVVLLERDDTFTWALTDNTHRVRHQAAPTRKEQLSRPIMMWVSSGMGVGPRLTSDMSFSI